MNNFGLSDKVTNMTLAILQKYISIKKVVVFGSRANGKFKGTSDIDIAVWSDDAKDIIKLRIELEESNIIYLFDVVDYNKIKNDKLRNAIDTKGKIFYLASNGVNHRYSWR